MKTILLAGVAALFDVPGFAAGLWTKKTSALVPEAAEYDWTGRPA